MYTFSRVILYLISIICLLPGAYFLYVVTEEIFQPDSSSYANDIYDHLIGIGVLYSGVCTVLFAIKTHFIQTKTVYQYTLLLDSEYEKRPLHKNIFFYVLAYSNILTGVLLMILGIALFSETDHTEFSSSTRYFLAMLFYLILLFLGAVQIIYAYKMLKYKT